MKMISEHIDESTNYLRINVGTNVWYKMHDMLYEDIWGHHLFIWHQLNDNLWDWDHESG